MTKLDSSALDLALSSLKEAYSVFLQNKDENLKSIFQDSCVKRFEYTYELAKKMMNKYLKYEYDKVDLPIDNVFREMFGLGMLENFENWQEYRIKRNETSHEYDLNKAKYIIDILDKFIKDVGFLAKKLKETK